MAAQDRSKVDSLEKLLKTNIADTTRINTLLSLADKYSSQNPDSAIVFAEKAKEIAQKINDSKRTASALCELGWDHYAKGDYPLALQHYFKALEIDERAKDKKGLSATLINIGSVYLSQGDYPKALEYYFKALEICEEIGAKRSAAVNLGNIGIVYDEQGDYPKALEYYFKALKLREELGAKDLIASCHSNIGIVYKEQGDYPKALEYYFKALEVNEELGNKRHIASNLGNIGIVYQDQGKNTSDPNTSATLSARALEYYFKALEMAEEIGDKNNFAAILGNIGSLYTKTGRFQEAESYLDSALALCDAIGALDDLRQFDQAASTLYDTTAYLAFQTGNYKESAIRYKKALEHNIKSGTAKDTLFNEEKSKDIGRLEQRHETEMADMQRKQEEAEALRIESEATSRRNNLQYSLIVIGLLVIGLLVILLTRFNVPIRVVEASVFIAFLIFFEFLLVLTDPYLEGFTGGEPAWKLLVNACLAGVIFPLHGLFEGVIKRRVLKVKRIKRHEEDGENGKNPPMGGQSLLLILSMGVILTLNSGFSDKIDSLKTELQKDLHDTTRVNTLNTLTDQYIRIFPDTALKFAEQAMKAAQSASWQKGIANAHHSIGSAHRVLGNYEKTLHHWQKALEIRKQFNDKKGTAASLGNIGLVYRNQGDYPKALEYYFEALKLDNDLGDNFGIAIGFGNIGIVYNIQGDYPKALEYYFEALKIGKELGKKTVIAVNLGNIGNVYGDQYDHPKALEYYFEALKMDRELGNKNGIARHLGNIGNVYKNQGDSAVAAGDSALAMTDMYPKALEYHFEYLKMAKEMGIKQYEAIALGNIGNVFYEQGVYPKALEHYFEALKLSKELGNKSNVAAWLGNIGSVYTQTGQFNAAEGYLDSALFLGDSLGALNEYMQLEELAATLHDTLAQLAFGKGQWKEAALRYRNALMHNRSYGTAKDSLFNEDKAKDIGRLEQRHETEMAELQRNQEEEEAQRLETEAKSRRNNLQYSGILIFMVLVFAGVFMLGRFTIPIRLAEGMIFFAFLLFFEFMLVMLDPYIENYSGGEPAYKLLFNAVLAGLIFPLHSLFETKLKKRLVA